MEFKEWLYLRILSGLKFVTKYFEGKLGEYYTRKNHEYADAFLEKFREGKYYWWKHQWSPNPETWARKPEPNPSCDHLKGGQHKSKYSRRDYSVAYHTFSDGSEKIWCVKGCGFVSRPGDQNWKQAVEMFKQSSNTQTSSERIMPRRKGYDPVVVTVQDSVPNGRP